MKIAKTWQRVLSMAVCLCMIVGLVPAMASTASAAETATLTIEGVTDYTKLAPYDEYPLVLTTAGGTVYTADQGVSFVMPRYDDQSLTFPEGSTTFAGTVSDTNVGYISKRGYFIATGFGQATLTVTASVDGEEVATGTLDITVARNTKTIYKYDFRKVLRLPFNGYKVEGQNLDRIYFTDWSKFTEYKHSLAGDDAENNPYGLITDTNYRGSKIGSLDSDPWVFYAKSNTSGSAPTDVSAGNFGTLYNGTWITFKVKIPETGLYSIQHNACTWKVTDGVAQSTSLVSNKPFSAEQSIYLAPVDEVAGDVTTTDSDYLLFTEDRLNWAAWNWDKQLPTTPVKKYIEEGEYYVTFKIPVSNDNSVSMPIGELRFTREKSIASAELNYGTNALKYGQSYTPTVTGLMTDSSAANLANATYKYSVTSGTAVSVNETTGALTTNSTGNATVKVDVTLDGVTVSDTVNVAVTEDLEYSYTYNFSGLSIANAKYLNEVNTDSVDYVHKNSAENVDWKVIDAERETTLTFRYYSSGGGYLDCYAGGHGKWITIRFNVERPGWYDLSLKTVLGTGGAKVRAYVMKDSAFNATFAEYSDRWKFGTAIEPYSVGTVNCYSTTANTTGVEQGLKRVKFDAAGEYVLALQTEENYNTNASSYNAILLKSFTIDRVAFADAAASTVLPDMDLSTVVPQANRILAAEDGAQKFALVPTMASGATYVDDLVGANATVTSSDTDVLTVSTVKSTNPEGAYGDALRTKDLVITPVAAGEANITITAVRDGVTYTEVIPIKVTHDVANFGTHYAYIRETKDEEKTIYNLALIAGIDDVQATEYAQVGFQYQLGDGDLITLAGKTKVYSQITAGTNNASITAGELGATYLFFDEYEFESGYADTPVKFRAYATLKDGTTVYGGWFTIDSVAKAAAAQ